MVQGTFGYLGAHVKGYGVVINSSARVPSEYI